MTVFSNDVDILRYEPVLFGELHLPEQVLVSGADGQLNGTSFTTSTTDFVSAQICSGGVIYLQSADGLLDGVYEIVSVDSSTELTVSVVRSSENEAITAPPVSSDISYRVSTFRPQASEIGFELSEYFGIKPGDASADYDVAEILDTGALRRVSVFGVLSTVYAMLASKIKDENFWEKSLHYRRVFEKARERCRLSLDVDSDGVAEVTKLGGAVRLVRD